MHDAQAVKSDDICALVFNKSDPGDVEYDGMMFPEIAERAKNATTSPRAFPEHGPYSTGASARVKPMAMTKI